ncbi:hypothetical protein [Virgibacillus litoralis]|uniref:Uncharacterized protein n=1 Tax=Virgibacillus litoralis TaxID=578221 RepID=A0ABS4HGT0_9BACI|nr:hypothetical protein [Virgibacillus litoralis]MBP1949637.1 hypothetical protein [Virgibacillus litoralis]
MSKNSKLVIISSLIVLFIVLYYSMSFSNQLVIRRTIFFNGFPISAITADIQNEPESQDKTYGDCYVIHNPEVSNGSEKSVPGVCMKKNKFGFYYDVIIGVH